MRNWLFALTCLAALTALPAHAQTTVAVTVYGEPITEDAIVQRARFKLLTTYKEPVRQDVINELADDMDAIKQAELARVDLSDSKVGEEFVRMCARMRVTPEQLTKHLEAHGIRLDTLKVRTKAYMAARSLHELRYHKLDDRLFIGQ